LKKTKTPLKGALPSFGTEQPAKPLALRKKEKTRRQKGASRKNQDFSFKA